MPNQSSPSSRRRGRASGGRTRSQSISRMQRAQALLNDEDKNGGSKAMTQSGQTSDSFDSGVLECRSDRSGGEMSSDLLNPRWRRLILAVSRLLAQRLSDATPVCDGRRAREMAEFVHTDATGGGSQMDLHQCFKGALEAMELSDKSTGFVLIGAYYYLQADDLMLTTQTWRSLVVTSLLVATNELCERAEREVASGKLRRSVAHWWSEDRADRAFQVFKLRDAFVRAPLNQQKIVALYFDLRARSLETAPLDDDSSSGLAVFEFPNDPATKRNSHVKASTSWSSRNGENADRSNDRSNASLAFSESKSRSTINDGYTSDHSVVSI
ncbi:unnamed protein product [Prorocentrum cordatum]|uniref:Cyclin N-terminal domain-containing protein n=3 Tax=Prorocentrum cordatum TaxID=2364126 RepID=A0ABN9S8Z7_9DINO|nr:unnamed protein product [Polarella glacialis]